MLRILEEKGYLSHGKEGLKYLFKPTLPREEVRKSALIHLLKTFFDGSTEKAVAAILDVSDEQLSEAEYERISTLIDQARTEEEKT